MTAPQPVKFDEVWVGQLLEEYGNSRSKYRVVSILTSPDRLAVRRLGGHNLRTVRRESLELCWFPERMTKEGKTD